MDNEIQRLRECITAATLPRIVAIQDGDTLNWRINTEPPLFRGERYVAFVAAWSNDDKMVAARAALIVAAVNAVPSLLDRLDAARADSAKLMDGLKAMMEPHEPECEVELAREIMAKPHPGAALLAELTSLRAEVAKLREIVGKMEWSACDDAGDPCCPACNNYRHRGHHELCELNKALASTREAANTAGGVKK